MTKLFQERFINSINKTLDFPNLQRFHKHDVYICNCEFESFISFHADIETSNKLCTIMAR